MENNEKVFHLKLLCFFFSVFHFFFSYIEQNKTSYIENLKTACAIKSVSAWPDHRQEIQKMVDWTAEKLKALGTTIELADVGKQKLPNGTTIPLPKVILGTLGNVSRICCLPFRRPVCFTQDLRL